MTTDAILEIRDLGRVYRAKSGRSIQALHDLSLAIPKGAFVCLTGRSGAGKTTLLALLGALDRPTTGTVLFEGRDLGNAALAERARARRRMGLVFQQSHLIRGLPLWENVTYPLIPRGTPERERKERAHILLDRVGLKGREHARPEELSGGEQQRASIARALAGEPEVLLADEPTSDLDTETAAAVVALFHEFHAAGKTLVVATHDDAMLACATQRVALEAPGGA